MSTPAMVRERTRARPGWLILGFAIVAGALTGPGQTIGVSVFIDHLVADLSLTRTQVSTAYLVGTLAGALALPSVGRLIDEYGVRRSQVVIGLLFGVALLNMSLVTGLVWLMVGFGGIRLLGQGSLSLVSTVTVQIRFDRTRGLALGIFATATAGLMALVPVVLAILIDRLGWRATWVVAAVVVTGIVVPVGYWGLRSLPTGWRRAERYRSADAPSEPVAADAVHDRASAMRTSSFWMLAAVGGAAGMMSTALNFHQIDLLGDAGLSATAAAALFIPQVVGSSVAGLSIGVIGDRVGTRFLPAISMLLLLVAQLLAAIAAPGLVVIAYAVVLGAAGGAVRTASSTLQPQWFGLSHIGSIQGALTLFNVAASAIGPVVLTITEQAAGSYPPALVALGAVPAAAMLFALGPNRGPAGNEPV
ncbi:MAG: MFS transporter [Ilumatobacter sp.]|nr:MFS transporter [Ilumatobacter sp.]